MGVIRGYEVQTAIPTTYVEPEWLTRSGYGPDYRSAALYEARMFRARGFRARVVPHF